MATLCTRKTRPFASKPRYSQDFSHFECRKRCRNFGLAPQTARYVRTWLQRAVITTGVVFRRIIGRARLGERLGPDSVTDVLKRVATRIGLPKEAVQATSGHSLRVGATQDLLALNEGLPAIMQTGRWKDARMVEHYGRYLLAGRSAMARAALAQGRTLESTLAPDGSAADAI